MPQTDLDTEILPFKPIDGIKFKERGKLQAQTFEINGVKVSFLLGDIGKQKNAQAVIIPQFPDKASERSVAGTFVRSDYQQSVLSYGKILKQREAPPEYGDLIPDEIAYGTEQTNFGKPDYFFHGVTVTKQDEPHLQFNAVRNVVRKAGHAAVGLSTDERKIGTITLPAMGTGPAGHLVGHQSARAIFAGIADFAKEASEEDKAGIHYCIVISEEKMYAPIIDEFNVVKNDLSYLHVPKEGEVGKKKINPDMLADHINLEKSMTDAYNRSVAYRNEYERYDI